MNKSIWVAGLLVSGMCQLSLAATGLISGRIVGIADGDTVTLLDAEHHQHRIRVAGIDAPEKKQPFGDRSRTSLAALVFNRDVDVVGDKVDRYGRLVGKIMAAEPNCDIPSCPKSVDASLRQLRIGMAWWYRKYAKEQSQEDRAAYESAESEARLHQRGLWADDSPVPPWDWRAKK